jgi:hypothetical protein
MNKIAPAFIAAKRAFGPVLKGKTNPAFKSKYANLEACLEAVDEACLNSGIALYQETFEDSTGVTVETVFLHESGESLRCGKLHVPAAKQDPQGYGSALTYARRYSLLAACGIAAEDDDGNAAAKAEQVRQAKDRAAARAEWLDQQALALESCNDLNELGEAWAAIVRIIKEEKDPDALETLKPIKDRMKAALETQGVKA